MSKAAHRLGDPNDDGAAIVSIPQSTVFVNDLQASIDGSQVEEHGIGEHDNPFTDSGSPTVFINNIPVNRTGDPDTCGHARAEGSPDVFIGP